MSALLAAGLGPIIEAVGKVAGDLVTTDRERLQFQLENRKLDQASDERQAEVNKVEAASSSVFVAGWRPAVGWVCVFGLAYQFVVRPLTAWAASIYGWPAPPPLEVEALMTLLFGMLGLGALRTVEKVKGAA